MAGDIGDNDGAVATYESYACPDNHVHVELKITGRTIPPIVFVDADEAYNFAQAILRAYDAAVGITPPAE